MIQAIIELDERVSRPQGSLKFFAGDNPPRLPQKFQ